MNFFEPLAYQLSAFVPREYCDIVALLGLFAGLLFGLRMGTEQLAPRYIQVIPMMDTDRPLVGRSCNGVFDGRNLADGAAYGSTSP